MKSAYFFISLLFGICFLDSCDLKVIPDEVDATLSKRPVASFTVSLSSDFAPSLVTFTNTSTNAKTYSWDLGDGTTDKRTSLSKTYPNAGSYNVRLIVKDSLNNADTLVKIVTLRQHGFDTLDGNFGPIKKVIALSNGEFVMAGTTYLTNPTRSEAYIMKRDGFGRIISSFTQKFTILNSTSNEVNDLILLSDGSFGICGTTLSGTNTDAFFIKIKVDGTVYSAKFGNAARDDAAQCMVEAADGYVIFGGYTTTVATGKDAWITKRNPNAITDLRFDSTYTAINSEQLNDLIIATDGSLMAVVNSVPNTGSVQTFMLKTNAIGLTSGGYPKPIGQTNDYNYGKSLEIISANRLVISGKINPAGAQRKGWIMVTDANGVVTNGFPPNFGTDAELFDAQEFTANGSNGWVSVGLKGNSAWFLKLSQLGTILADVTFGTVNTNVFYAIRPLSDGGFIVVGGKAGVAYMVRTDSDGKVQ